MTNSNDECRPQQRRTTLWSKEKISQLIEHYRRNECLWNVFTEEYKCKESRSKAIVQICSKVGITKYEYGKKIHNLRNQFNSEMKKLERRIEESGGTLNYDELSGAAGDVTANNKRCRWEHFQSLMFLRTVIEPRPGFQSILGLTATPGGGSKKTRTKQEYEEDIRGSSSTIEQNSETTSTSCQYDESIKLPYNQYGLHEAVTDQNYSTNTTSSSTTVAQSETKLPTIAYSTSLQNCDATEMSGVSNNVANSVLFEQNSSSSNNNTNKVQNVVVESVAVSNKNAANSSTIFNCSSMSTVNSRDQWDAFGELIANELRNLNSELSRKKLKRKIMQAMLEVGDEDDGLSSK